MFDAVKQPEFFDGDVSLRHDRFYCSHCIDTSPWDSKHGGWQSENGVRVHVAQIHGVEVELAEYGRDFFQGADFSRLLAEWRASHDDIAASFGRWLLSLDGPDDLAFDCGGDPPLGLLELS